MTNDLEFFDNKLIVLYILESSNKPLTQTQIAKFCEDFEDITYFDIFFYLESLKASKYIEEKIEDSTVYYFTTALGSSTLNELLELVPRCQLIQLKKNVNKKCC